MKKQTKVTVLLEGEYTPGDMTRLKKSLRPHFRRSWALRRIEPDKIGRTPRHYRAYYTGGYFDYKNPLDIRICDIELIIGYTNRRNGITYISKGQDFRFTCVYVKPETVTKHLVNDINRCKIEIIEVE